MPHISAEAGIPHCRRRWGRTIAGSWLGIHHPGTVTPLRGWGSATVRMPAPTTSDLPSRRGFSRLAPETLLATALAGCFCCGDLHQLLPLCPSRRGVDREGVEPSHAICTAIEVLPLAVRPDASDALPLSYLPLEHARPKHVACSPSSEAKPATKRVAQWASFLPGTHCGAPSVIQCRVQRALTRTVETHKVSTFPSPS